MPRRETLLQLTGGLFLALALLLHDLFPLFSSYFGGFATALFAQVFIDWTKRTIEKKPKTIGTKLAVESKTKAESSPEFFRKRGPLYVDFKKGYFAKSHDLDSIKEKLMKEKQIIIHGPNGSGKSFLLRNLGFKLFEEEYETFLIELKEESFEIRDIANFFAEKKKACLLVDDAHLDQEFCESILWENLDIKIAFTCKYSSDDLKLLGDMVSKTAGLIKDAIETDPKEIGKRIVDVYLKKNGLKCNSEEKRKILKYPDNLWVLSKVLTVFHEKHSLKEDDIYKSIENFILQKLQEKYKIKKSDSILLVITNFSKYDIPVEKKFIEKKIGNKNWINYLLRKNDDIDKLIRFKEISKYKEMLKIDNISMAELYFETLERSTLLAQEIKEEFNGNLELGLFMEYIQSNPRNLLEIFIHLGGDPHNKFEMMKTLIENELLINIILRKLKNENDIRNISWFLFRIARINSSVGKEFLKSLKITNLLQRAINLNDIARFHFLLLAIKKLSRDAAKKAIQTIPEDQIIMLYNNCEKIGLFEPSFGIIRSINRNIISKVASNLEKTHLVKLLNSENNLGSIRSFLFSLPDINEELFSRVLKEIEINHLIDVINNSNKCGAIASFLGTINNRDPCMANEIYSKVDKDHLVKTIFDSNKAGAVDSLLFTIRNINLDNLSEIVKRIRENLPEAVDSDKLNAQNIEGMVNVFSSLMPEIISPFFKEIGARGIMKIINASPNKEIIHLIKVVSLKNPEIGHEFEEIFRKMKSNINDQA